MQDKFKYFTIGQASKYLGVSKDTLRRWEKRKILKAFRSPTGWRYYSKTQLDYVYSRKPDFSLNSNNFITSSHTSKNSPASADSFMVDTSKKIYKFNVIYLFIFSFVLFLTILLFYLYQTIFVLN